MKLSFSTSLHHSKIACLGVAMLGCLPLTSCSENRRLAAELKELKTDQVELTTESTAINSQAADSYRKMHELEKSQQGDDRAVADAEAKAEVLRKRIAYLQSAVKAANEQSDKLNTQTTQYRVKYLGN